MSLINDALKRAKQSQSPTLPPAGQHLHFRPVESDQSARHGLGLILPIVLALFALLGLFFVWELAHKNHPASSQSDLVARAATSSAAAPTPVNPPAPVISQSPTTPPAPPVLPAAPQPEPAPVVTVTAATSEPPPAPAAAAPTPSVPEEPPAPPKPAPLRLQGIAFSPAHPSAVINGKTVYVGDKLGEFRVSAITADSATLLNASQTNVLTFGD